MENKKWRIGGSTTQTDMFFTFSKGTGNKVNVKDGDKRVSIVSTVASYYIAEARGRSDMQWLLNRDKMSESQGSQVVETELSRGKGWVSLLHWSTKATHI